MLNQILKFTVITTVWLWLKPRWRALLAFVVSIIIITVAHREYLNYVEISGNQTYLVWSYLLKWSALLVCIIAYLLASAWGISSKKSAPAKAVTESARLAPRVEGEDDGFDFIRRKKRLNSQAEKLLEASKARDGKNAR